VPAGPRAISKKLTAKRQILSSSLLASLGFLPLTQSTDKRYPLRLVDIVGNASIRFKQ
jgi:hypothetical protein